MKKLLGIIGVGLFTGAVAYILWNKTHIPQEKVVPSPDNKPVDTTPEIIASIIRNLYEEKDEINNAKISSANSISERHEEAAQIMKDAIETICKNSEVPEDTNSVLEQMSIELGNLLNED